MFKLHVIQKPLQHRQSTTTWLQPKVDISAQLAHKAKKSEHHDLAGAKLSTTTALPTRWSCHPQKSTTTWLANWWRHHPNGSHPAGGAQPCAPKHKLFQDSDTHTDCLAFSAPSVRSSSPQATLSWWPPHYRCRAYRSSCQRRLHAARHSLGSPRNAPYNEVLLVRCVKIYNFY